MQKPIISPWLIYLANDPQAVAFVSVFIGLAGVVIAGAAASFHYIAKDEAKTLKDRAYRYAYRGAEKEMMAEAHKRMAEAHKREADAKPTQRSLKESPLWRLLSLSCRLPSVHLCHRKKRAIR